MNHLIVLVLLLTAVVTSVVALDTAILDNGPQRQEHALKKVKKGREGRGRTHLTMNSSCSGLLEHEYSKYFLYQNVPKHLNGLET